MQLEETLKVFELTLLTGPASYWKPVIPVEKWKESSKEKNDMADKQQGMSGFYYN